MICFVAIIIALAFAAMFLVFGRLVKRSEERQALIETYQEEVARLNNQLLFYKGVAHHDPH